MFGPLPAGVPKPASVYHSHVAPVPRLPPLTVSVVASPGQMLSALSVIPVGSADSVLTVTVAFTASELLQSPSARTQ